MQAFRLKFHDRDEFVMSSRAVRPSKTTSRSSGAWHDHHARPIVKFSRPDGLKVRKNISRLSRDQSIFSWF
jgi:hypothetical protein